MLLIGEIRDAHALIAAVLWYGVELLLEGPCQRCQAKDVDGYSMLYMYMHVVSDGHEHWTEAHLVASSGPTWIKAFCGFELVRVKGGI